MFYFLASETLDDVCTRELVPGKVVPRCFICNINTLVSWVGSVVSPIKNGDQFRVQTQAMRSSPAARGLR